METTTVSEQQILEIARKIGEQPGVVEVWLYGSHATGTAGPDSDVDLLAVYDEEPDTLDRMRELGNLFPRRSFAMDILVMGQDWLIASQDVPGALAYVVKRQGRILYDQAS